MHTHVLDTAMTLGDRIKALRVRLGLTQDQMAKRLKVSRPYLWQIENNTRPGGPKLERDVELLEQMPNALVQSSLRDNASASLSGGDVMPEIRVETRPVPVLTFGEMGALTSYEMIPRGWQRYVATDVKDPQAFAVSLRGDSMEPQYKEGDVAIVLPSAEPRQGSLVIVVTNDDGVVFKLYTRRGNQITLSSYNPAHEPYTVNVSDVRKIYPVHSVVKFVMK